MLRIVKILAFVVVFFGRFKIISYLCTKKTNKEEKNMAFRNYQESIYDAVVSKTNWAGSNVVVRTEDNVTKVYFYGNRIAVVNHETKTAEYDNCGYNNACTNARINAVKIACENLGYN